MGSGLGPETTASGPQPGRITCMPFRIGSLLALIVFLAVPYPMASALNVGNEFLMVNSTRDSLGPGQILWRGQSLTSPKGTYQLSFQSDGDLVLRSGDDEVWSSGTAWSGGDRLIMHHDGNLVMHHPFYRDGGSVWSSGTSGYPEAVLRLTELEAASIRQHDTQVLWSAGLNAPDVGLDGQRHLVFDRRGDAMLTWLVESDGSITDVYPVSGKHGEPPAGRYEVYSKSPLAYSVQCCITMDHMVRFAWGRLGYRIGFHSIPVSGTTPLQSEDQLGQALSAGCVRQRADKAEYLYEWAPIGTPVVVLG